MPVLYIDMGMLAVIGLRITKTSKTSDINSGVLQRYGRLSQSHPAVQLSPSPHHHPQEEQ